MNSQYRKNLKAILEACKQYIDEKISGGEQEMILEVASITGLTNSQCQDLSCGDVVVENNNGAKTTYIVFSKTATTMSLTYVDSTNSKEVKYEVSNSAWAYDETVTTALGGGGSATHLYMISFRLTDYYIHFITKTPSGLNGKELNNDVDNTQVELTSAEQLALFNALFDCIHTNDTVGVPPRTSDLRCSFAIPNNYYPSNANITISDYGNNEGDVSIDYKCVNTNDGADYSLNMSVDNNGVTINTVGTSITDPIVICESQIL